MWKNVSAHSNQTPGPRVLCWIRDFSGPDPSQISVTFHQMCQTLKTNSSDTENLSSFFHSLSKAEAILESTTIHLPVHCTTDVSARHQLEHSFSFGIWASFGHCGYWVTETQ